MSASTPGAAAFNDLDFFFTEDSWSCSSFTALLDGFRLFLSDGDEPEYVGSDCVEFDNRIKLKSRAALRCASINEIKSRFVDESIESKSLGKRDRIEFISARSPVSECIQSEKQFK
jgi:hypothetical protein